MMGGALMGSLLGEVQHTVPWYQRAPAWEQAAGHPTDATSLAGSAGITFLPPQTNPFGLANVGLRSAPFFTDMDGDGDLDAFIGEINGSALYFENTGTATGPAFAGVVTDPFGLSGVGNYNSPSFADIDGDGDLDGLVGEADGTLWFFENTGTATSPAFAAAIANPFGLADVGSESKPTFADIDGDGDLDVFAGESFGNTLFFENTGTMTSPAFAAAGVNAFGLTTVGATSAPTFIDLDNDGDLDALMGESSGNVFYFENTGSVTVPAFAHSVTDPFGFSDVGFDSVPTFADLDGDSDPDAIIGDFFGDSRYFENISSVPLPVELAAFTGLSDGQAVVLRWQTQSETNNAGFEVEHRAEAAEAWQKEAFIEGAGTTAEPQAYSYRVEGLAPGPYRFRLKQRDFDGSFRYSAEIEMAVAAPVKLVVEQNYPNPFRASTEITYALPVAEHVRLVVYDVRGREVARLVDGQEAAGEHRVSWVAGTVPSGLYVYRLEASARTVSRTMMRVR